MTARIPGSGPGFLDDPDAVVLALVAEVEPALDQAAVAEALVLAAPTRAQRRRLAAALLEDPDLLVSGRPHGPPQIERLIRALLPLGGRALALPRCGHCGRTQKLSQRDGALRICGTCDRRRRGRAEPCTCCGSTAQVAGRDRDGLARCRNCLSRPDEDPVAGITSVILRLSPVHDPQGLEDLVRAAVPQRFQLHRVLAELRERPALLTGEGAHGSPRVNALIRALVDGGVDGVLPPRCPGCARRTALTHRLDGLRCCRRCYDDRNTCTACVRCGQLRAVASRTASGEPVCGPCYRSDPANHEPCAGCGRVALVHRHDGGPPFCRACFRAPTATCSICRRDKPCHFADTDHPRCEHCTRMAHRLPCGRCARTLPIWARTEDGKPLCNSCSTVRAPCHDCGRTMTVKGRSAQGPLCATCYRRHPVSFRPCVDCGSTERLHHHGLCPGCAARQQLLALLTGPEATLPGHLEPVFHLLAASDPTALLPWLGKSAARAVLAAAASSDRPLTHDDLDRHLPSKAVDHLRKIMVAGKVLPGRDEYVVRFEQWTATVVTGVEDPHDRRVVRSFATWHVLRRLRARSETRHLLQGQVDQCRAEVRAAVALVVWLRANDSTLADCTQHHIDRWLTDEPSTTRHARAFLTWAHQHKHAGDVEIPAHSPDGRIGDRIADDHRWELVRQLLHDDTFALEDRVAGLMVLLFGQTLTRIARLRRDQITTDRTGTTRIRLGQSPLDLPSPLDDLALRLAGGHHGRYVLGHPPDHHWLFPGAPGRPLSTGRLRDRLAHIGVRARAGRNATLMDLAGQLPAAVLSKLLGIHISTAVHWTNHASARDAAYAAEVSRRNRTH
ncbi:site-specific integrase [Saccharothrix obliqua]|uniref:site-specific integrase n=1 Tax=Saccharothrix obliqua TaxID=2861747 RepID=UPI001C5EDA64|nr:site-specific integrase [Saccharothrix obliqua]MBW4716696.1 site-specific integrase [Saccharothrix obliqua]